MTTSSERWRRMANAPALGVLITPLAELPDKAGREFRFGDAPKTFSMLAVRNGDDVRAYVNLCPHQWLPLTFRSDGVISGDGAKIVCSNHQAEFATDDGRGLSGPIEPGCRLFPIPVHVDADRMVRVGWPEDLASNC